MIWGFDSNISISNCTTGWPTVIAFTINFNTEGTKRTAAVEEFKAFSRSGFEVTFAFGSIGKDLPALLFLFFSFTIKEIHIKIVPTQPLNGNSAFSTWHGIALLTLQAFIVRLLHGTALGVGHTNTLMDVVESLALRAEAIGVDITHRVSELAFEVWVDEVKTVTVGTFSKLVELLAVTISILANTIRVYSVSLSTGKTFNFVMVICYTVYVLEVT